MLLLIYSNIKYFFECILEVLVLFCYRFPLTTVQAGAHTTQKDNTSFVDQLQIIMCVKLFMNEIMITLISLECFCVIVSIVFI
jgi:hypothetical protein